MMLYNNNNNNNNLFNSSFYQQGIENSYQSIFNQINMANAYSQNQNLVLSQMINAANQKCSAPNVEQKILKEKIDKLKQENQKLKTELQNIIEKEDEKQKILKITIPGTLKNNINAAVVITNGDISGDIHAENVVCMTGNVISRQINANKIFTKTPAITPSNEIDDKKQKYRKNHPDCKYCKFRKKENWHHLFLESRCEITDKNVEHNTKLRAFFCKNYMPTINAEEDNL